MRWVLTPTTRQAKVQPVHRLGACWRPKPPFTGFKKVKSHAKHYHTLTQTIVPSEMRFVSQTGIVRDTFSDRAEAVAILRVARLASLP